MRLVDLLLVYVVLGVACAVAIFRSSSRRDLRSALGAALAIPIWPLWAPIALTSSRKPANEPRAAASPVAADRVREALREGIEACAGTALEPLLSRDAGARIGDEVDRAVKRLAELDALLARPELALATADKRAAELEESGASAVSIATARLQVENITRLRAMRDKDARTLDELADLVQALKAQLALARFAGSSLEGASGIVSEVWARVEGLGAAINGESAFAQPGDSAPV